jgi:hypothetical protein
MPVQRTEHEFRPSSWPDRRYADSCAAAADGAVRVLARARVNRALVSTDLTAALSVAVSVRILGVKGTSVDIVLNFLTGDFIPRACLLAGGRFLATASAASGTSSRSRKPGVAYHVIYLGKWRTTTRPDHHVRGAAEGLQAGAFHAHARRVFLGSESGGRLRYMASKHVGKIVVRQNGKSGCSARRAIHPGVVSVHWDCVCEVAGGAGRSPRPGGRRGPAQTATSLKSSTAGRISRRSRHVARGGCRPPCRTEACCRARV